ncbi:TetR/AcrR family transcriptional regulator [Cupriavidus oxalaticus]|uniref:TetR/AcrR family transcriptional regulator n=1 Tax=Cupriavidus oxalaticus TaxID=96344 RepID=UPI0031724A04
MKSSERRISRAGRTTHDALSAVSAAEPPSGKATVVMAAARSVFLGHGFSAATTDMIQQAAGVSKATVYSHYPTKEALFIAVIDAECERFIASIRALRFQSTRLDHVLMALAQAYLEIVLSAPALDLFRVVVADAPRFPELARKFYLAGPNTLNEIVAAHLDEAAGRGETDFSAVGRDVAASLFVNLVRGELQLQCLTHPGSVPSAAQRDLWARAAVTTFVRAFGKQ